MLADIVKRFESAALRARDDDTLIKEITGHKLPWLRDFGLVAREDPGLVENLVTFDREDGGIVEIVRRE